MSAVAVGCAALTAAGAVRPEPPRSTEPAELLGQMSLEEKVGQLFVTYAYGSTADTAHPDNQAEFGVDTPAELVQKYHLGGIIHFSWTDSLHDPRQVAELSNGLQDAATGAGAGVPLTISIDQEQGRITRMGKPLTQFPGNMALGANGSPADAGDAAAITARELRAMGLNQNYAPSGDVNVNAANPVIGVRSFSSDPSLVARLTAAQVRGYEDSGPAGETVSSSVKHFPGHGDTAEDSHTALPIVGHDPQQWERVDAPPFREAVAAGADSVMSAHLLFPALDRSGEPATLSPPVLTGKLREELGYDGVVVTDSLKMDGVRAAHPDSEIPVLALEAGADQMLMPLDLDAAIGGVLDAVRSGRLTEQRIDRSVQRILEMKAGRGVLDDPRVDPAAAESLVGAPDHVRRAQEITDRSTTLLRNDGALPLGRDTRRVLVAGADEDAASGTAERIRARGPETEAITTGEAPEPGQIRDAVDRARGGDLAVVLTDSAWEDGNAGQLELIRALREAGVPVVAAAVGDPYDAGRAEASAWLATYSDQPVALEALTRVLFGETEPAGALPVAIPGPGGFPFGHGLGW
nr:glycoside hydrolase family 3 protein [Saccharopolyspora sp. HNM0983]